MNFRRDSDKIHFFVIDVFNDVTGMDRFSENLWDVQSKGAKNNSPNAIGKGLVTLYKNYLSDLEFNEYILFLGGVSSAVRKDETQSVFDVSNITDAALIKLTRGLKLEAIEKSYVEIDDKTDQNINNFLKKVLFVVDNKTPCEYVKAIIKDHPAIVPEDTILTAIFNEIRNAQSGLKNSIVEGVIIQTASDVLHLCRHLTNNEIRMMVLQRIINRNPVERNIMPPSFLSIYNAWPPEQRREKLDNCVQAVCRALFNKNAASAFWALFENVYTLIVAHPTDSVQEIYQSLNVQTRNAQPDFDVISLQYFISIVKDGIQQ